jgi:PPOX class probable F420-dependent enzyme
MLKRGRPRMANHMGLSVDTDGLLEWAWVATHLTNARNYWLATTRADGRPHVAPIWGVWHDDALYFGVGEKSVKGRNLVARPDVTLNLESGDEVVILEGRAAFVEADDAALTAASNLYAAKYGLQLTSAAADESEKPYYICLRPSVVLAWVEHDFPRTATRWD